MRNISRKFYLPFLLITLLSATIASCNRGKVTESAQTLPEGVHAVEVIDVIQTSNYTYLEVFENNKSYWIAVTARDAKPGDVIYFSSGMEMKDFNSRELGRTFASILFVDDASDSLIMPTQPQSKGSLHPDRIQGVEIEHVEDGITLGELFANSSKYEGKTVKIRGMIVKVNQNIMNRNWVHIQDGTGAGDNYDLTITTLDAVRKGSVVTFEGKIILNKDFGSGYSYDILMEEAKASDEKIIEPEI
jgi:hypothetical protein